MTRKLGGRYVAADVASFSRLAEQPSNRAIQVLLRPSHVVPRCSRAVNPRPWRSWAMVAWPSSTARSRSSALPTRPPDLAKIRGMRAEMPFVPGREDRPDVADVLVRLDLLRLTAMSIYKPRGMTPIRLA